MILFSICLLLSSAQPIFTASSEKLPDVLTPVYTVACPANDVIFHSMSSFAFTSRGFLAIAHDRSTLFCYDFDGNVSWKRQPPEKVISAIRVSGDGHKIVAHNPLSEDAAVVEVLNSEGTVLWRDNFEAGFKISGKGKYLYSEWDALDGGPLIVVNADNGKILWQHYIKMYWAELLNEETLVAVNQFGSLRFFDMASGQILAEENIGETFLGEHSHTTWSLRVSADGNFFTVLGRSGLSKKVLMQTYDRRLSLMWIKELNPGNYETSVGISENGRLFCISNPKSVQAYDNLSGNRLWQIDDRILNNDPLVTNRFIAMAQTGFMSHVFITAKNGELSEHFTTNSLFFISNLPFLQTPEGKINLTTDGSQVSIIEIKKENDSCKIVYYRWNES